MKTINYSHLVERSDIPTQGQILIQQNLCDGSIWRTSWTDYFDYNKNSFEHGLVAIFKLKKLKDNPDNLMIVGNS